MTTIKFTYNDSYGQPSRGSLAFMPHRRHAANETEILPKPFTVPLLNGEATVNLKPNSSSWVWIITEYFENVATSFYTTIPDTDGVIPHTDLVHISPSSIPAAYDAVEPAWWAEMRQYKQTVGETLLKSTEALTEAQEAIEIGKEAITTTRDNASLSKAYFEQARDRSAEAQQYRNEAQEAADRAASGPESAAARAEAAATRSETARDRAITAEDSARGDAAQAQANATSAQQAASSAITARTEATTQADRATTEANRAKGYADDLLAGPSDDADRAEQARDDAQGYAQDAANSVGDAQQAATQAQDYSSEASQARDNAQAYEQSAQTIANNMSSQWDEQFGEWQTPTFRNNAAQNDSYPLQYRVTPLGLQIRGSVAVSNLTNMPNRILDFVLPEGKQAPAQIIGSTLFPYSGTPPVLRFQVNTITVTAMNDLTSSSTLYIHPVIIPWSE